MPLFFAIYPRAFLRSRSILSHPPLYLNDCSLFWFTRSHPLCGWLWVNQKREVPNVGGIAMVIIRSFGIAETTSFFRIAVPSFYRLSRQSVANPFPPVTGGREIGIRFCKQNRMVCFTFRTALFLVFCLPLCVFFIAPSETLCFWTANLFRWMDTKEFRSSPFVPKKITPDGFAVPNIFCRPKLF